MGDQLEQLPTKTLEPTTVLPTDEEYYNSLPYHKRTWFRVVVVVLPQVILVLQAVVYLYDRQLSYITQIIIWFACCFYIFCGETKNRTYKLIKNFLLLIIMFALLFLTLIILLL